GDSDFLLFEEADAFLGLEDDPDSPKVNLFYYDPEGDILLLEAILNSEPSPSFPNQEQNLPSFKEELKAYEAQTDKSSGINPEFCTHKILMEEDYKPAVQHQRRVNPKIHDVIKKEVEKLLDAGLIYPIFNSPWVSPVHCVPKKGGFTVVENEENELIPTRLVTGWRVCIDYRCMLAIFHDMVEKTMEVFMDDFSVFGNSFENYLSRLDKMLQRCEDTNISLNWEKSHFMVKEGIVLGHKISKNGIEVDKAKINVISKLPYPTTVKGIRSFLGQAGFYRRFIQDFSKISRPMTHLLEKNTPFVFFEDCI
nr:retrovirus-related Pol polyprotein from transposon opus [Tanacetum cinerariifolium]